MINFSSLLSNISSVFLMGYLIIAKNISINRKKIEIMLGFIYIKYTVKEIILKFVIIDL